MQFFDTKNAIEGKRIKSNYQRGSLLPTNFYEKTAAQWQHGLEFNQSTSKYSGTVDDYDFANKEIEKTFGVELPNPLVDDMAEQLAGKSKLSKSFFYLYERTRKKGFGQFTMQNYKDQVDWWNSEIQRLQEKNPNVKFKTFQDFQEERKQKAITSEFLIGEMERSSRGFMTKWGSSLVSGFGVYMTDPITTMTLPASLSYSIPKATTKAIVKTALMEGGWEAARSTAIEGQVQSYRKDLGLSYGTRQALYNIFAATAGGAILGPTFMLGTRGVGAAAKPVLQASSKGFNSFNDLIQKNIFPQRFVGKKLNELIDSKKFNLNQPITEIFEKISDDDLIAIYNELPQTIKNNPTYKDAVYKLQQAIVEEKQNPYVNTVQGQRLHDKHFTEAYEQVARDEPIVLTDDPTVETKAIDLEQKIQQEEANIKAKEETLKDTADTEDLAVARKKLQKEINESKKEIKRLKEIQQQKFPPKVLPKSLQPPKEPKTQNFLQWLGRNKIKSDDGQISEVKAILDKSTFRFTKKGGYTLDQLLTRAREDGWLPEAKPGVVDDLDINDVLNLINENPVRPGDEIKLAEYNQNLEAIDQQLNILEEKGIDPYGLSEDDLEGILTSAIREVSQDDMAKFADDGYIDNFSDDYLDEMLTYLEEGKIAPDEKATVETTINEETGEITTKELTMREIRNELVNEKTMIDELAKCEGLSI